MIKFFPRELHRIPWKNKNSAYHLQISVLVPEIFKFKKCVKYAHRGAHLVECYCKESSIFIQFGWDIFFHHIWSKFGFKNLNISGTKKDIWIVNSIFLLTQATFLCFKMAAIGKMRFSSYYHSKTPTRERI